MRTYDAVLVLVVLVWWLFLRREYDWKRVVLFYMGGVMLADLGCAILFLLFLRRHPALIRLPALLMPAAGIVGLAYGAWKGKLKRLQGAPTGGQ